MISLRSIFDACPIHFRSAFVAQQTPFRPGSDLLPISSRYWSDPISLKFSARFNPVVSSQCSRVFFHPFAVLPIAIPLDFGQIVAFHLLYLIMESCTARRHPSPATNDQQSVSLQRLEKYCSLRKLSKPIHQPPLQPAKPCPHLTFQFDVNREERDPGHDCPDQDVTATDASPRGVEGKGLN